MVYHNTNVLSYGIKILQCINFHCCFDHIYFNCVLQYVCSIPCTCLQPLGVTLSINKVSQLMGHKMCIAFLNIAKYCDTCIYNIRTLSVNIKFICTSLETGRIAGLGELFRPVSQRVQMNLIFNDNVLMLCLSCNVKKVGKLVRFKVSSHQLISLRFSTKFVFFRAYLVILS